MSRSERDESSALAPDDGRCDSAPYRDRRDALVARRRALHEELLRIDESQRRAKKVRAHLHALEQELDEDTRALLAGLEVARGCAAPWDEMVGDDVARHCPRCGRAVLDVSAMTRAEIDALFSRAARSPFVRLHRRRDGRVGTGDCSGEPGRRGWRALATATAGVVLGASLGATGAVWLAAPDEAAAQAATRAPEPVARSVEAPSAPVTPEVRQAPTPHGQPVAAPTSSITEAELAAHVRATSDESWEIDRPFVDRLLGAQSGLMRAARVIPIEVDGVIVGVRLFGIRRGSVPDALGLLNGDTLLAINGHDLASPERALEAYTRLRSADTLALLLERRGQRRLHVYRIVG